MTGSSERIPTDRIIQALRETNGLVSLAAKRVPCSISTINTRRKRVQAVEQVIQECRGELVDLGELALRKAVLLRMQGLTQVEAAKLFLAWL